MRTHLVENIVDLFVLSIVDCPVLGRCEADDRLQVQIDDPRGQEMMYV
jgi:hypothetical protein